MPTASDEDRAEIVRRFGNIDPRGPENYLTAHGWKLTRDWTWVPPTPDYRASADEINCIQFLIDEWDYGGVA